MVSTIKRGRPRRYTAEQRAKVLEDIDEHGVRGAGRKHGVAPSTVEGWLKQAASRPPSKRPARGAVPRSGEQGRSRIGTSSEARGRREATGLRRVERRYAPSQKATILEYAATHGVTAAHQEFDVSRFTIYDWRRKVKRAAAGKGTSPTAGPSTQEIEAQRDKEILNEWHRHPGLGPSQIRNQLRRKGVKVSVHTARRVMEESGYRPPKVKREPHDERFEAVRPNHLWHLDFLHRHINRASTFTLILLDDCSRFVVGHGVDDAERADLVIETFCEAVRRHGRPEIVLHDKGSAFWSWRGISRFTKLLTEMGIDPIAAKHKEWNGKLEVFNANLAKEIDLRDRHLELFKVVTENGVPAVWLMGQKVFELQR